MLCILLEVRMEIDITRVRRGCMKREKKEIAGPLKLDRNLDKRCRDTMTFGICRYLDDRHMLP